MKFMILDTVRLKDMSKLEKKKRLKNMTKLTLR